MSTGFRKYITAENILTDKEDIATTYHWDLEIVSWPSAVYFPSDQIFKTRLTNLVPPGAPQISNIHEMVHGYHITQYGDVDYSGAVQFQFQDFIDQSVAAIWMQFVSKIMDPDTRNSMNKADLMIDLDIYQLDRALNPIKKWTCRNGTLEGYDTGEQFGGETQNLGKVGVNLMFEFVKQSLLNL